MNSPSECVCACVSVNGLGAAVHLTQICTVNMMMAAVCHITHLSNLCCSQVSCVTVNCVIYIDYVNRTAVLQQQLAAAPTACVALAQEVLHIKRCTHLNLISILEFN